MKAGTMEKTYRLSTDKILIAASAMVKKMRPRGPKAVSDFREGGGGDRHLDVGAGHGDLIQILRQDFQFQSSACDYTDTLMEIKEVPVKVVDLNTEKLPFSNAEFDVITCTEVLEHVEHYRETIREMFRVLKPGGVLVVSTPNILNLKSRIRFLVFGFYNLFGPLHFKESQLHTAGGHINPIGAYYLLHALLDANFSELTIDFDKKQSTSIFWLLLLYPFIRIFSAITVSKETRKFKTIDEHNSKYVGYLNAVPMLLGRTIIVGARKPLGSAG